MQPLEVGRPYPGWNPAMGERASYQHNHSGHQLSVFYNLTPEMVTEFKAGKHQFALLVHGSALFFLHRLSIDAGWTDTPYNWWAVPAEYRDKPDMTGRAHALHIILVDARTGLVQGQKLVSLTRKFTSALHGALDRQRRSAWQPQQLDKDIQSAYRKWPSPDAMAADAIARCIGGEKIDSDEPLEPANPAEGRRAEVAQIAGVELSAVTLVTEADARIELWSIVGAEVFEVLFASPCLFWRADGRIWFDDPEFGPVVAVEQLEYDSEYGLQVRG